MEDAIFGISSQVLTLEQTGIAPLLAEIVTAGRKSSAEQASMLYLKRKIWHSERSDHRESSDRYRKLGRLQGFRPIYLIPCHAYTSLYLNEKGKYDRISSKKNQAQEYDASQLGLGPAFDASENVYWFYLKEGLHRLVWEIVDNSIDDLNWFLLAILKFS